MSARVFFFGACVVNKPMPWHTYLVIACAALACCARRQHLIPSKVVSARRASLESVQNPRLRQDASLASDESPEPIDAVPVSSRPPPRSGYIMSSESRRRWQAALAQDLFRKSV